METLTKNARRLFFWRLGIRISFFDEEIGFALRGLGEGGSGYIWLNPARLNPDISGCIWRDPGGPGYFRRDPAQPGFGFGVL